MSSKFVLIIGLVGFVGLIWLAELLFGIRHAFHLPAFVALGLAGVPMVLWLAFFYLMDRHEPEPIQLVAGVCLLGAMVAGPLSGFVLSTAAPAQALEMHGIDPFSFDRLLYAILVAGLAQEMCKYAVVRYTIYVSREFDEPMDGIVYMMACGSGFALWVNYHRMSGQGHQVYLSYAAAQAAVTTLAQASFAGVLGYVMGRAKFSQRSAPLRGLFVMLGLLGAACLNGGFAVVENWLVSGGMAQHPWRGLGYAALFAAAVFAITWFAAQRLLADSPFRRPS